MKSGQAAEIVKIRVKELDLFYGRFQALRKVSLDIPDCRVTALIGPSGCGKSSFLRSLNRMNDLVEGVRLLGLVEVGGQDIYAPGVDVAALRKRVGLVFQRPNPFPMSIYDNVAYGPRIHGLKDRFRLDDLVEQSLRAAGLWNEVRSRLRKSALGLSGGQQQRLCIARVLAVQPEVLLMDEPASALDPIAAGHLEELIRELRDRYCIVIVTHSLSQAVQVSDFTAVFFSGELTETGKTKDIFFAPQTKKTRDYILGKLR